MAARFAEPYADQYADLKAHLRATMHVRDIVGRPGKGSHLALPNDAGELPGATVF